MALITVPIAGQTLNSSRPDIESNFKAINDDFKVDHVEYNLAGKGKHKTVTLTSQTYVLPSVAPLTAATECSVFSRPSLIMPSLVTPEVATTQLFFQPASSAATAAPVEFSYAKKAAQGFTILPSGIWIAWGAGTAGDSKDITFFKSFPTTCVSVQMTKTPHNANQNLLSYAGENAAGFTAYATISGAAFEDTAFTYIAIGY